MSITLKTPEEIEKMRIAGQLAAEQLRMIAPYIQAGITTNELDQICHDYTINVQQAIPAPLNYHGYPKSICTSVNNQICHGIPSDKKLKNGDIINIDVTVIKDGYFGDTSKMFFVGEPSILAQRLCRVSHECMKLGIEMVKPGRHLGGLRPGRPRHCNRPSRTNKRTSSCGRTCSDGPPRSHGQPPRHDGDRRGRRQRAA